MQTAQLLITHTHLYFLNFFFSARKVQPVKFAPAKFTAPVDSVLLDPGAPTPARLQERSPCRRRSYLAMVDVVHILVQNRCRPLLVNVRMAVAREEGIGPLLPLPRGSHANLLSLVSQKLAFVWLFFLSTSTGVASYSCFLCVLYCCT